MTKAESRSNISSNLPFKIRQIVQVICAIVLFLESGKLLFQLANAIITETAFSPHPLEPLGIISIFSIIAVILVIDALIKEAHRTTERKRDGTGYVETPAAYDEKPDMFVGFVGFEFLLAISLHFGLSTGVLTFAIASIVIFIAICIQEGEKIVKEFWEVAGWN